MIYSFSGSQSVGKSTLLQECKKHYGTENYMFVDEVTRKVKRDHNAKINEETDSISQTLILNETLLNHICTDSRPRIMDRCILDTVIYTGYFYQKKLVDKWVWDAALGLYKILIDKVDVIFYPNPYEVKLTDDGERSTNIEFRQSIIESFEAWIQLPKLKDKVIQLNGTVEQRMTRIKEIIK